MSGVVVFNPSGYEDNPRRRRRRRSSSSKPRRRRARASVRRRVRARANPGNPPRRRRRSRRMRAFRNPSFMGLDFTKIGLGVAGAIGTDLGGDYLTRMLPPQLQTGAGKYAVKAGLVLAGSMLLGRFVGRQAGIAMATGGAIMLGAEAVHEFVLPQLTGGGGAVNGYQLVPGMSGYELDTSSLNGVGNGWSPGWGEVAQQF